MLRTTDLTQIITATARKEIAETLVSPLLTKALSQIAAATPATAAGTTPGTTPLTGSNSWNSSALKRDSGAEVPSAETLELERRLWSLRVAGASDEAAHETT